jgi:hypothetical protein
MWPCVLRLLRAYGQLSSPSLFDCARIYAYAAPAGHLKKDYAEQFASRIVVRSGMAKRKQKQAKEKDPAAVKLGRKGGFARAKKLSKRKCPSQTRKRPLHAGRKRKGQDTNQSCDEAPHLFLSAGATCRCPAIPQAPKRIAQQGTLESGR